MTEQLHARTDALLRRLVRREAATAVRKLLARHRPQDIAAAVEHLTWEEQRRLFEMIDDVEYAADVLSELSDPVTRRILEGQNKDQISLLLDHMELDDATDVVEVLPDAMRTALIADLGDDETAEVVRELLEYDSDSAGGIMSPNVFKMPENATCGDAIRQLQQDSEELESIYYVYVVDELDRLVGVTSLRSLLTHPPATPLANVMSRQVITVAPQDDQEEVAKFVARYDLLAVPVTDPDRTLLGIVTVDDVVDVIREEAAEDMLRMAGVLEGEQGAQQGVFRQSWLRAGWLLATLGGGILAAEIIGIYEDTLASVAVLAGFIPVIMGMGGNVGIQSATVAVRGLATGDVHLQGPMNFVWNEARVGVLLGVLYAVLLGCYGTIRYMSIDPWIGPSVASSIFLAISMAAALGAGIPVFLERLGVDPAIATGPFVTTAVDVLGIIIYFNVARFLLGL